MYSNEIVDWTQNLFRPLEKLLKLDLDNFVLKKFLSLWGLPSFVHEKNQTENISAVGNSGIKHIWRLI